MSRPDLCPNCGASTRAHTGTYCHECGEPLSPRRDDRSALSQAISNVESSINDALLHLPNYKTAGNANLRRALLEARGNIREAMGEGRS